MMSLVQGCNSGEIMSTIIPLLYCVGVCVFMSTVSIPCPSYEVLGFQPQAEDIPNLGSVHTPAHFQDPLHQRCMPVNRRDERLTDNRHIYGYQCGKSSYPNSLGNMYSEYSLISMRYKQQYRLYLCTILGFLKRLQKTFKVSCWSSRTNSISFMRLTKVKTLIITSERTIYSASVVLNIIPVWSRFSHIIIQLVYVTT